MIDRAQPVRARLEPAAGCGCAGVHECALFHDAALPPDRDRPGPTVLRDGRA